MRLRPRLVVWPLVVACAHSLGPGAQHANGRPRARAAPTPTPTTLPRIAIRTQTTQQPPHAEAHATRPAHAKTYSHLKPPWALPDDARAELARLLVHAAARDQSGARAARRVWDAFVFAHRCHRGQFRKSGAPYITHPLAVAAMLAKSDIDLATIMCGLLHDTVEDTGATLDVIGDLFGDEVATLVDGVTKLSRLELEQELCIEPPTPPAAATGDSLAQPPPPPPKLPASAKQAANLRKLVLAMSEDIRVLVVKLIDRTHNMRTLGYVKSAPSRRFKADETLRIYAPLAVRIGMYSAAAELEALAFAELEPEAAASIKAAQDEWCASPELEQFVGELRELLGGDGSSEGGEAASGGGGGGRLLKSIHVRRSSAYRVWLRREAARSARQLRAAGAAVADEAAAADRAAVAGGAAAASDFGAAARGGDDDAPAGATPLGATGGDAPAAEPPLPLSECLRLAVELDSASACYEALGLIHQRWRSLGGFKDYISTPKPNHYQSIHTTVLGPRGSIIQLHLRTSEMHAVAEGGIVAYWRQQERLAKPTLSLKGERYDWLRALRTISASTDDGNEFIEAAQMDLSSDQIFCFTPSGELVPLPRGASVLDFAYAIHTSIGNHCESARVNGRPQPIHSTLRNADRVEITTGAGVEPALEWIDLVSSGRARAEIRRYHNAKRRREAMREGGEAAAGAGAASAGSGSSVWTADEAAPAVAAAPAPAASVREEAAAVAEVAEESAEEAAVAAAAFAAGAMEQTAAVAAAEVAAATAEVAAAAAAEADTSGEAQEAPTAPSYKLASCCRPVPGDDIRTVLQRGPGTSRNSLVVHRTECRALATERHPVVRARWGERWPERRPASFDARLRLMLDDPSVALPAIAVCCADVGCSIVSYRRSQRRQSGVGGAGVGNIGGAGNRASSASAILDIEVRDLKQLNRLAEELSKLPSMWSVERV